MKGTDSVLMKVGILNVGNQHINATDVGRFEALRKVH
jgi:hypothetical protein